MPISANPLASVMGVGGAAGDLGLSQAVTKDAQDTADALRKKKMLADQAAKQGAPAATPSALGDIMNGFL